MDAEQGELFDAAAPLPGGLAYAADFITPAEETALLEAIRELPLSEARYRAYTAKRRTVSYGSEYDFTRNARRPAPPMPAFLRPLGERAGQWVQRPAEDFVHALVTEYPPGAALGWHRDVPDFEVIVGISLGASCRMRFRPYRPAERGGKRAGASASRYPPTRQFDLELEPRSAYVMQGPIRWEWQHGIPPTPTLRYSITLRTMRRR